MKTGRYYIPRGSISLCPVYRAVTMSPPVPRINTFFQKTNKPIVEPISKIFIIACVILGVNRLPLLSTTNTYCIVTMLGYTLLLNVLFFYLSIVSILGALMHSSFMVIDSIQYLICTILGFLLHKRLQNFYLNLNKIDKVLGINSTNFGARESVYNFLQLIATLALSIILYLSNGDIKSNAQYVLLLIPIKLMNCFELHYYGHLFSLMIPRLKGMYECMKSSYLNNRNRPTNSPKIELQKHKESHLDMMKLVDFYNDIIIAYDCLNEAVKWQILTLLISTFSLSLGLLYYMVKTIIWGNAERNDVLLVSFSLLVIQMFPLLVPCLFADRVQREVCLIKDFLACKLYENTLDKPSRSSARTLLALIETRNLSFSLFHMFDIDISLPFKFMALLLTYLIILLQFDKVITQ